MLPLGDVFTLSQGEGKSSKEALKRIDYGGSATLLVAVRTTLRGASYRFTQRTLRFSLFSYS
jgi:hypothetical protein